MKPYEQGCCQGGCWGCADHLRTRSATAIKKRWEGHQAGRDLCLDVYTVPEHRRAAAADYRTWAGWVEELLGYLKAKLGLAYAVGRADPAGRCKDSEYADIYCECSKCVKWHPHLNLYWVRQNGEGFLTDAELLDLKLEWARIVGAEIVWKGDAPFPIVDVQHKYLKDPATVEDREARAGLEAQRWHRARYMGRHWPAWQKAVPKFLRIRWYGKFPTKVPSEEKQEKKLRLLYSELNDAGPDVKRARKLQRRIDRIIHPKPCRCGCAQLYPPEPEGVCDCCGARRRTMACLDHEEALTWKERGPDAARAEMKRRRREARFSKPVVSPAARYKASLDPPVIFERSA